MKSRSCLSLKRLCLHVHILLFVAVSPILARAASISPQQKQLLDLVNRERARAGLSRLQWDDHLADAARAHTQMMVDRGQLSHQFRGEPPLPQRAGAAGAHFNSVAENVAFAGDLASLHQNLMQSPHHRANILSPASNAIGIGLAEKHGELYVTEDFARLLPSYSTDQFSQQVVAAFNRVRQSKGLPGVPARPNPRLQRPQILPSSRPRGREIFLQQCDARPQTRACGECRLAFASRTTTGRGSPATGSSPLFIRVPNDSKLLAGSLTELQSLRQKEGEIT